MRQVWIIVAQLSGSPQRWAFSDYKGTFALVPMSPAGFVKGAHGWDTKEQAEAALALYRNHPEAWSKLSKLNPRVEEMTYAKDALASVDTKGLPQ